MAPLRSCRSGRRRAPGPARVLSRACTAPPAPPRRLCRGGGARDGGRGMGGWGVDVRRRRCGGDDDSQAPLRSCRAGRRRAPGLARVRSRADTATSAASGPAASVRVEAAGGGMGGVGGGTGLMCGGVDHGRCGGGDDAQAPVRSCRAGRDRGDGAQLGRPGCEAGPARRRPPPPGPPRHRLCRGGRGRDGGRGRGG